MKTYQFNKHGVCTNPEVIYYFMPAGALAWAYLQITVAEKDGLWDYGHSSIGSSSPCAWFQYPSKEDAIEVAIDRVKSSLEGDSGLMTEANKVKYINHFTHWHATRNQLVLTF